MVATSEALDSARAQALDQMERNQKLFKIGLFGATAFEALLLASAIILIDWNSRPQVAAFVLFMLAYMIIVLAFLLLASHINHNTARILAVLADGAR